jgi:hypothetical protein
MLVKAENVYRELTPAIERIVTLFAEGTRDHDTLHTYARLLMEHSASSSWTGSMTSSDDTLGLDILSRHDHQTCSAIEQEPEPEHEKVAAFRHASNNHNCMDTPAQLIVADDCQKREHLDGHAAHITRLDAWLIQSSSASGGDKLSPQLKAQRRSALAGAAAWYSERAVRRQPVLEQLNRSGNTTGIRQHSRSLSCLDIQGRNFLEVLA